MYEAYELFTNNIRSILSEAIKGEITTWFDCEKDSLQIKIYNHGLKFVISFPHLSRIVISNRRTAKDITNEVIGKYKSFILHKYLS